MRFLASTAVQKACNGWVFPLGTFVVNITGCLAIGFLAQLAESKNLLQPEYRAFFLIGILGGYTTFSSFGYETFQLIRSGEFVYATANAVLQVVLGLFFVWLGTVLARLL
ncbi:MAG: fluoride exporter [Cyanobacteriota bacterium erpe_2018_sw_21hr_WHONDRS-SW48-000092_B_bin.40]|jgi:CrcB protein|nr:fluoride exporter [Cyanobacteriota bacterium erpe_2018_sw_21hr_WHONDRS-SW48-000092_B_bin.40]